MTRGARPSRIGRQAVSYLLAPETIEALRRLSSESEQSMGKTIDRAVASLDTRRLTATMRDLDRSLRAALDAIGARPEE